MIIPFFYIAHKAAFLSPPLRLSAKREKARGMPAIKAFNA